MKLTLFAFVSLFSLSAFAQFQVSGTYEPMVRMTPELQTVISENPCIMSKDQRNLIQLTLDRPEKEGQDYIGVTSYGDVAILKNNNRLQILSCSSTGFMTRASNIQVMEAGDGCNFGQIIVMNTSDRKGEMRHFRSPVFSEKASLCDQKLISVSDAARDAGKDVEELYFDAISGSKVSEQ